MASFLSSISPSPSRVPSRVPVSLSVSISISVSVSIPVSVSGLVSVFVHVSVHVSVSCPVSFSVYVSTLARLVLVATLARQHLVSRWLHSSFCLVLARNRLDLTCPWFGLVWSWNELFASVIYDARTCGNVSVPSMGDGMEPHPRTVYESFFAAFIAATVYDDGNDDSVVVPVWIDAGSLI